MKRIAIKNNFIFNLFFCTLMTFFIEILFKLVSGFEVLDFSVLRIFLSCFILTYLIVFISNLCKKNWLRNTINLLYLFIYSIYALLQIGFINYLGVYISFNTSSQFGAVKDYIGDYIASFKAYYFIVFIPFIIALIFYLLFLRKKDTTKSRFSFKYLVSIGLVLIAIGIYYFTLTASFMQNELQIKSNAKLFNNPDIPTIAVNQFGVAVYGILDFKTFIFPVEEEHSVIDYTEQEAPLSLSRKVSPFLDELAQTDENKKYSALTNYFASQNITDYNDYSGMFEGKNVIVILIESANEAIINEEYFPNFTKLYNEGWHWVNNYSPRNSCATGNNEFSAMTSLYSIYNTCTSNVYKNNTYYESIFGLFNDKGYETTSFHDFVEWYYKRDVIHPNMGSGKYYGASALGIKTSANYGEWPSDEEFFEKAFDIILNRSSDKPFMTFLTTVTSHQPYSNSSTYGDLYKNFFKEKGYSTAVSRYFSKLKVVDNAIGLMLDKLNEAGILDDTVIVMLADHYPYGLNKSYIEEIIDHDLSDYDIEKTPFLIYNSNMTPKTMNSYNSYINLVPTLANLLNLDYDPRLYMGEDLMSDNYESRVVFADGSWKNEIAYYNASTSKIKYYGDQQYTSEEIQEINSKISLDNKYDFVIIPFNKMKNSPSGEMHCLKKKIKNFKTNLVKQKTKTSFSKYMLYNIAKKCDTYYFSKSINTSEYNKYKNSSNKSKNMKRKYNIDNLMC